tara:strand:+ start:4910 stop:5041 length:132 start_codon:yes stop_codon:yes gene_type:complete
MDKWIHEGGVNRVDNHLKQHEIGLRTYLLPIKKIKGFRGFGNY